MGRTEYHPVTKRQDFVINAVIDFFCHLRFSFLPEKVSPGNITGEERIAGKYHIRVIGNLGVPKYKGDTLFSMPRSLQNRQYQ